MLRTKFGRTVIYWWFIVVLFNPLTSSHYEKRRRGRGKTPTFLQMLHSILFLYLDHEIIIKGSEALRKLGDNFKLMSLHIPSEFNLSYMNFSIHAVDLSVNINIFKEAARFWVSNWEVPWNSKALDFYFGGAFFFISGVGLTSLGTAATSGLLYSPRW
jgi:hypothetical protein